MDTTAAFHHVNVFADHPGGCYTCRWFGERIDVAVWCGKPGQSHVRSQADRGCAFWEREPGADDDLPTPQRQARAVIAPMLAVDPLTPGPLGG
ncbi:MAG TPA: hypothetical protein VGR65_03890 [Casimicrobiaceae bacterium]|jgi:hypothetical protein|nr:hypothetical protein [Casimicrobiaceae bacterium]